MIQVKVCVMKDSENLRAIAEAGPDRLGFIFHPISHRNALELDPERVRELPEDIVKTGVFVTDSKGTILRTAEKYGLHSIQLHGIGEPDLAQELRKEGYEVVRALRVAEDEDLKAIEPFREAVDLFLFDTKTQGFAGGSGRKFDHSVLEALPKELPFFLAGGIGPEDGEDTEALVRTGARGVDINSRFETAPGKKDPEAVQRFIERIRAHEPLRS
jgi:phosphoribosylanthranilate isomerase